MRMIFYAPLKPVDHPSPSGDRRVARAFLELLRSLGHEVRVASRLRSYDRDGDERRQRRIAAIGARTASRVLRSIDASGERPDLFFTYHTYHKAPDHLGPRVADALGIQYVIAEGSISARQAEGPWRIGFAAAHHALRRADRVLAMTARDEEGLRRGGVAASRIRRFPPFTTASLAADASPASPTPRHEVAAQYGLAREGPWLLTVAMMRDDVKKQSYEALFRALDRIRHRDWQLIVVGDGPARAEIEAAAAPTRDRVSFLGALDQEALADLYRASDVYVWPGLREAYGMAILEAQAAGLPVVAFREGGIDAIVRSGVTGCLVEDRDEDAFAEAVARLLEREAERLTFARDAKRIAAADHGFESAQARMRALLDELRPSAERAA